MCALVLSLSNCDAALLLVFVGDGGSTLELQD